MEKSFQVKPDVFKAQHRPFDVDIFHEASLTQRVIDAFLQSTFGDVLGLAPSYNSKCALKTLAIYNGVKALLIRFPTSKDRGKKRPSPTGGALTISHILLSKYKKVSFQMDTLTAALYIDFGLHINRGIDLFSLAIQGDRHSVAALKFLLGGDANLHHAVVVRLFSQDEKDASTSLCDIALRAWSAYKVACPEPSWVVGAAEINTVAMNDKASSRDTHLAVITRVTRDAARRRALKPTRQRNEIEKNITAKQGILEVTSSRFKTRLRNLSSDQTIEIKTNQGMLIPAKVTVKGRSASLIPQRHINSTVRYVSTIGREFTAMEKLREKIVLSVLTGSNKIFENPFVQAIWLPSKNVSWIKTTSVSRPVAINFVGKALNPSQNRAVSAILSNKDADRLTLIHGPPGTGKTTVIAASITSIISAPGRLTAWVIAQSNVAVKNVAEKLADVGFFGFKILVSEEFHFDWHEHLYEKLERNLIRSDDFPGDIFATERLLLHSRVVLCTLSMLSNDRLSNFARIVPLQTIIIDEASQIEVGDYLPLLSRFKSSLRKLAFIGDHKQLAPYGHGDIPELQSIFEMSHLLKGAIFLDTQYRMPVPIGNFISKKVYDGKLKSVHTIDTWLSCSFIDVATGREKKSGRSWVNLEEVASAIRVASKLHTLGKSFRIITPYDAQRSKLENALKASYDVPWQDKCFNVDSFQGNEADYIIISVVRSEKIGFMKDVRRTNVMLTRCKRNMIILANRSFVEGVASSTLIGQLAKESGQAWITTRSVLNGAFHLHT